MFLKYVLKFGDNYGESYEYAWFCCFAVQKIFNIENWEFDDPFKNP